MIAKPDQRAAEDLLPTRTTLLNRLKNWRDEQSWQDFFDAYWRLIYGTATRAGLSDAEAQDVVQETVLCVAKKIQGFTYDRARGSFKGWLLKLTYWRIADQMRKRAPVQTDAPEPSDGEPACGGVESMPDPSADMEAFWNEEWERTILAAAVERVKLRIDAGHFQIFDLYALKQWPAAKVAQTLHVKKDLVYLIKHRVSGAIKDEVRKLETHYD